MRTEIKALTAFLAVLVVPLAVSAQQFALAVDVPSNLGGTVYGSNQIVKYSSASGGYSLASDLSSALGPAGHINALTQVSPGVYYMAVDVPTTISGTTYQPSDIIKDAAGTFSLQQSGSSLGIPAGVGIGALTKTPSNALVIALTAPATIGGTSYLPGDLILVTGTSLSLYWRGTSWGVPAGARVAGAEVMATNELLVQFDIPVTVASTTFAVGEILQFSGGFLSTPFFDDGSFPAGSVMTDFALPGSPGTVPDGLSASTPLKISRSGGLYTLTWGATCGTDATGYGIYRGTLGSWYSHSALSCLVGSATSTTLSGDSMSGNRYFLIVPTNGDYEGGYGNDSHGNPIPSGSSTCRSSSDPSPCP